MTNYDYLTKEIGKERLKTLIKMGVIAPYRLSQLEQYEAFKHELQTRPNEKMQIYTELSEFFRVSDITIRRNIIFMQLVNEK